MAMHCWHETHSVGLFHAAKYGSGRLHLDRARTDAWCYRDAVRQHQRHSNFFDEIVKATR